MKTTEKVRGTSQDISSKARRIRTFIADDSPFMLVLLSRILTRDERFTIVGSATDGVKAFYRASMSHPDLVLMDTHMSGVDGAEVTRWLKQLKTAPIVFLVTSDDRPEVRRRSLNAGADAFFLKSDNLAVELRGAIQKFFPDHLAEKNGQ